MSIGERIKRVRKEKGLTQKQLADRIDSAVITVRQYENSKRQPSLTTINSIAAALDKSLIELLDEEPASNDSENDDAANSRYSYKDPAEQLAILNKMTGYVKDYAETGVFIALFEDCLNIRGKRKVMEYMEDLIAQSRYLKPGIKPIEEDE